MRVPVYHLHVTPQVNSPFDYSLRSPPAVSAAARRSERGSTTLDSPTPLPSVAPEPLCLQCFSGSAGAPELPHTPYPSFPSFRHWDGRFPGKTDLRTSSL